MAKHRKPDYNKPHHSYMTKTSYTNTNPFKDDGSIVLCKKLFYKGQTAIYSGELNQFLTRSKYLFLRPEVTHKNFNARELTTWINNYSKYKSIKPQVKVKLLTQKDEDGTSVLEAWSNAAQEQMKYFNSQDLANSIYAFGRMVIKPQEEFLNTWYTKAKTKIDDFNSQELANIIYAFGRMGIEPQTEFLNAWYTKAKTKIDDFNSQELANIIYAFSRMGIEPQTEFLNTWYTKAKTKTDDFNSQELANSIYAFSLLGIKPQEEFLNAWYTKAREQMEYFESQGLANSIYAFSLLGIKPPQEFLNAWYTKAKTKTDDFNSQELANSIYAFLLLEHKLGNNKIGFLLEQLKEIKLDSIDIEERRQIHTIYQVLKLQEEKVFLEQQKDIIEGWQEELSSDSVHTSRLQKKVESAVKSLNKDIDRETYIIELGAKVDIFIPESNTIIQVDGPTHFYPGTDEYTAKTRLNTRILEKVGYKVLRVSYHDINNSHRKKIKTLIQNKLEELEENTDTSEPRASNLHDKTQVDANYIEETPELKEQEEKTPAEETLIEKTQITVPQPKLLSRSAKKKLKQQRLKQKKVEERIAREEVEKAEQEQIEKADKARIAAVNAEKERLEQAEQNDVATDIEIEEPQADIFQQDNMEIDESISTSEPDTAQESKELEFVSSIAHYIKSFMTLLYIEYLYNSIVSYFRHDAEIVNTERSNAASELVVEEIETAAEDKADNIDTLDAAQAKSSQEEQESEQDTVEVENEMAARIFYVLRQELNQSPYIHLSKGLVAQAVNLLKTKEEDSVRLTPEQQDQAAELLQTLMESGHRLDAQEAEIVDAIYKADSIRLSLDQKLIAQVQHYLEHRGEVYESLYDAINYHNIQNEEQPVESYRNIVDVDPEDDYTTPYATQVEPDVEDIERSTLSLNDFK